MKKLTLKFSDSSLIIQLESVWPFDSVLSEFFEKFFTQNAPTDTRAYQAWE